MLEHIKEENIWDFLKNDVKPIVIYGMGNGAEKIIATLEGFGMKASDIFASDEFVRGHSFLGYKVLKYSEICEKYDDFNVVLAFATHLDSVMENIEKINITQESVDDFLRSPEMKQFFKNFKHMLRGYKPIKRTRKRQIAKAKHMMTWHDQQVTSGHSGDARKRESLRGGINEP